MFALRGLADRFVSRGRPIRKGHFGGLGSSTQTLPKSSLPLLFVRSSGITNRFRRAARSASMYDVTEHRDAMQPRSAAASWPKPHRGPEKEALDGPGGYLRSYHADRDGFLGVEDAYERG